MNDPSIPPGLLALAQRITRAESTDPREVLARSHWLAVAEPGDRVAKVLVELLGAERALRLVGGSVSTRSILREATRTSAGGAASPASYDIPTEGEVAAGRERWAPRLRDEPALRSAELAAKHGFRLICPADADWPPGLDDLGAHAPIALWVRGDIPAARGGSVAIVGARAVTSYGSRVTADLAAGLAERGCLIVSGGAVGVDGVAHRAALASDSPTVAILAGGLDRPYPQSHLPLFERIASTGALLSEVGCEAAPTRWRFLQRNRLIAAFAGATVVVEAGVRSGSLNTASHAASMGRPLGAVPGPVTASMSAGCHRLLRERDATLIRNVPDVLELIGSPDPSIAETATNEVSPSDAEGWGTRVWDALGVTRSRSTDLIAREAGISSRDALALLGRLELRGVATRDGDGWRRRRGEAP